MPVRCLMNRVPGLDSWESVGGQSGCCCAKKFGYEIRGPGKLFENADMLGLQERRCF